MGSRTRAHQHAWGNEPCEGQVKRRRVSQASGAIAAPSSAILGSPVRPPSAASNGRTASTASSDGRDGGHLGPEVCRLSQPQSKRVEVAHRPHVPVSASKSTHGILTRVRPSLQGGIAGDVASFSSVEPAQPPNLRQQGRCGLPSPGLFVGQAPGTGTAQRRVAGFALNTKHGGKGGRLSFLLHGE